MARTARALAIAAVIFVGLVFWTVGGWFHDKTHLAVDHMVLLILVVSALVSSLVAAWTARGRPRAGWILLAIGLAGWGCALASWTYFRLVRNEVPFPSVADAAYLLLPFCASVALVQFAGERTDKSYRRVLLDALIVAGSLLIVSWVTILSPIYTAGAPSRLELAVALAYPISDVVLLPVALLVLVRALGDRRLGLMLLSTGLA